ncbi:hypothetical protein BC941DRAFT_214156 [Chlamydoabsidia padenii]|nr:hypothetical protein BC941DRAFT_214156 [Chlamydoabsidia padenii]
MSKQVNVETRSGKDSGKRYLKNMVLTPQVLMLVIMTCSWNESMYTIMKDHLENMYPDLFWWIWNLLYWILFAVVNMVVSSVLITLWLVNLVQATLGQEVIILKGLNWWKLCWTSFEKKRNMPIVYKGSKCPTLLVVVQDLDWDLCYFPKVIDSSIIIITLIIFFYIYI